MPSSRGYLTLAAGAPRFLELAVDMTLSLREHTEHPVALVADEGLGRRALDTYPAVFDEVCPLPARFDRGRCRKYGVAEACPFDQAVFVDADCFVLGALDGLFDALAYSPLAMVGSQLTVADDENHHGFRTRWLMRRFGLPRYMKTNSGLFAFRRDEATEIMEECLRCYTDELRPALRWHILLGRWLGDEIAFGVVGGRRDLGTLPIPSAMYWWQEFESLDPDRPTKPLLHFIWPPEPPVVDRLVADARERRRVAGVPGDAERHWRDEVAELRKMVRRRRWAERLGLH